MAPKTISHFRWNFVRSETWPEPLTSPGSSPGQKYQRHYIVVHGLRDATNQRVNYQAALERCVEDIAKRAGGSYQVQPFRFGTLPLLLDGGGKSFKSAASKLRRKLDRIRRLEFKNVGQSRAHEEGPISSSHFIFITHGLGSWLVKAAIAKQDLAPQTLGLLFLDAPRISVYLSSPGAYLDAVIELWWKFHNTSPSPTAELPTISRKLLGSLWTTDGIFQQYQRETSEQCIQGALDPYFVNLWGPTLEFSGGTRTPTTESTSSPPRSPRLGRIRELIQPPHTTTPPTAPNEDEVWERVKDLLKRLGEPAIDPALNNTIVKARPTWEDLESEGQSLLARGELKSARTAFEAALDTLGTPTVSLLASTARSGLVLRHAEIRMQMAIIDHRCGKTDGAEKRLDDLEEQIEKLSQVRMSGEDGVRLSRLTREVQRRLGASLLSRGKYPDAIKALKKAASAGPDVCNRAAEVGVYKAQRDLAVAYGLMGALLEARKTLRLLGEVRTELTDHRRSWPQLLHPSNRNQERSSKGSDSVQIPLPVPVSELDTKKPEIDPEKLWAAAHVAMFSGQYNQALQASTKLFRLRQSSLGRRHIKTLKAANLRAYLLACTFQLEAAREECGSTLRVLSEDFGPIHRQTLEATWVLIVIFRKYRSFMEATATGESLNGLVDECFTQEDHPMRLKTKAELAHSYSSDGRNKRAKELLEEVVRLSGCRLKTGRYGSTGHELLIPHADRSAPGMCSAAHTLPTLEYQVKLARVDLAMGDWQAAQERALHVLQTQRERRDTDRQLRGKGAKPRLESGKEPGDRGSVPEFIDRVLSDIDQELNGSGSQGNLDSGQSPGPWIQGSTFSALRLLAWIQFDWDRSTSHRMQPLRILETVQRWQEQADVFGPGSLGFLATTHDYAVMLRGYQLIAPARECFKTVFVARARRLGISHLATLSTKRELVVTECLVKNWVDPESYLSEDPTRDGNQADGDVGGELPSEAEGMSDEGWHAAETCFLDILQDQDCYLGPDHPESLQTLLWVLAVQLQRNTLGNASETRTSLELRLQFPSRGQEMNLSRKQIEAIQNQVHELYAAKEFSKTQYSETPKDRKLHGTPDMNPPPCEHQCKNPLQPPNRRPLSNASSDGSQNHHFSSPTTPQRLARTREVLLAELNSPLSLLSNVSTEDLENRSKAEGVKKKPGLVAAQEAVEVVHIESAPAVAAERTPGTHCSPLLRLNWHPAFKSEPEQKATFNMSAILKLTGHSDIPRIKHAV
ncbi:uncharacterized protein C8A04DRAFT_31975 [Dichotomopilus funicola]|uniref:Uncharacterized protein n=1 Tax=Dichotomopilus funicola TaxID=1934379 RepID=A0AAN6UWY8_9PEZI|nr:hypothetical protein C8A04DRAFT_31975 [Dichotomopilus funicola]